MREYDAESNLEIITFYVRVTRVMRFFFTEVLAESIDSLLFRISNGSEIFCLF